ncbi:MAG TPA: beta-ketoacyl synthase N-terminal-like domain-containing protein [Actinophytocola sp.]|uniref:beta-ketoacyl synthase N-terminal-like domain-containing protein n=1 Tax=Actinophytocola sp. TaxID=1872138 RepID=UPI002DBEA96D|nr:beta-ketoacyl synthase N-terminal-like domain-containing protein [Actinophytocola sp.]HEU5470224.1 beta-ketoacyl synthase N-terminal-like domain-containing protein [Actinophytocola sp.]
MTLLSHRSVISRFAAVSPYGIGAAAFDAGMRERRSCAAPLDPDRWAVPFEQACLVPGFDIQTVLGAKGTRSMDRITGLAVAATAELLRGDDGERLDGVGTDAALVLGVNIGSAQSIMDFTRDSLVKELPYLVNPAHFPNTVMNCAAAQCGIRSRLRGPNVTVSGGRSSALLALNYARRLLRAGRAGSVLCGAAEEFSVTRAWLEHHAAPNRPATASLGEGCAMLLVEPAGRRSGLAEVLAIRLGVFGARPELPGVLAGCVRGVLTESGTAPAEVWAMAAAHDPELAAADPDRIVLESLGCRPPVQLPVTDLVGDTQAASGAFGLAGVLALAAHEPAAAGRTALVSTVDRDGTVGCVLVRLA